MTLRDRLHDTKARDWLFRFLIVGVLAADAAMLAFWPAGTTGSSSSSNTPAPTSTSTAATTGAETRTTPATSGGVPACSDIEIPARPVEAVTCRTASATLTIVDQAEPLLLGDTHVRILAAFLVDSRLTVRARVRNETPAEQGIQAGGQELYVNLGGLRVDAAPTGDLRVAPHTGETVSLRFALTPGALRLLRRAGGEAELGVRPWSEGSGTTDVGVVRFRVRTGAEDAPAVDEPESAAG